MFVGPYSRWQVLLLQRANVVKACEMCHCMAASVQSSSRVVTSTCCTLVFVTAVGNSCKAHHQC